MSRANRRREQTARAAGSVGGLRGTVRRETGGGHDWYVRHVRGNDSERTYRCPGCQQGVAAGTPHVVAWPADGLGGLDERRHWHAACWGARERRAPRGSWK